MIHCFVARRLLATPSSKRPKVIDAADENTCITHTRKRLQEDGFDPDNATDHARVALPYHNFMNQETVSWCGKPMTYYCAMGDLNTCQYLLSRGASVTGATLPIEAAALARSGGASVCKWLLENGSILTGTLPLRRAMRSPWEDGLDVAKFLILNGGLPLDSTGYPRKKELLLLFGISQRTPKDEKGLYPKTVPHFLQEHVPPGWLVSLSRTRNKPYYTHHDYGQTWHCPISIIDVDCIWSRRNRRRASILKWALSARHLPSQP